MENLINNRLPNQSNKLNTILKKANTPLNN